MKVRKESIFTCEYCGEEFSKRYDLHPKYCSSKCFGKAMSEKRRKYAKCPICGTDFIKKRSSSKYCSIKCSAKAKIKRVFVKCDYCGTEIEKHPCHIKEHNFCSRECMNNWNKEHFIGENAPRWSGGVHNTTDGYLFIRQEDGSYKAEHRIVVEENLGRKLNSDEVVHHIDENKKNNSIDNLTVLTRAEHARIHREKKLEE